MSLSYKNAHLTKTWVITLFCALIAIGLIVTLVLVGDVNLLRQQWLIPNGGKLWGGVLTEANCEWVFSVYKDAINHWAGPFGDSQAFYNYVASHPSDFPDMGVTINAYMTMFDPLILIPTLGTLALSIIIPLIFKIFKLMEIDVLVFSITTAIVFNGLIFTGLIPTTIGSIWIWIIRIVIVIALAAIGFFSLNALINFCISHNHLLAEQAIKDISNFERERNASHQTINDLTKEYKDKDKMTYVDVDKPKN
ncbi:MAG: hypothetical protein LBT17_00075 [Mycoplasmataceae bacterium]|nr:hypothetical protein [Mycoplasmataceae bacterium]